MFQIKSRFLQQLNGIISKKKSVLIIINQNFEKNTAYFNQKKEISFNVKSAII